MSYLMIFIKEIMHDIAPVKVEEKTITYNDPIVPTAYIEKPPSC